MTRTISVVTPVYRPERGHLIDAYESLAGQKLPEGWAWEWVLQEDGPDDAVAHLLPDDDRIKFRAGRKMGPCLTRNMALARSTGELIKNLDADDVLTPGTLARDIAAITANHDVHWSTSRLLDLMPDGSLVGFPGDPEPGRIAKGSLVPLWRASNYRLAVHPTSVCIRRKLLTAIGGWMGVPGSEDTGMLVAASAVADGWFHDTVGLHYRKHEGQLTAHADHQDATEWEARMSLIGERAEALAATRWTWSDLGPMPDLDHVRC